MDNREHALTSFEVVSDDLRAHASHLDGFADRIGTAISAANTGGMSEEAYGLLCSFLPPIINPVQQDGVAALQAASEAVTTTSGNVRTAATAYQDRDTAGSQSFQRYMAE
jgi:hypothetical protein